MSQFSSNFLKHRFTVTFLLLISVVLISFSGCDKNEEDADFAVGFSYEYIDANNVRYVNTSTGEYSTLAWDFGNGETDQTSDKNKSYDEYYLLKGNYEVSLKITNSSGVTKTETKTVEIAADDASISVSFTTETDPDNPNIIILKNTSQGEYDSFKWVYRDQEVYDEMVHDAYFPLAGDYVVELVVMKSNQGISDEQTVTITKDDPDYNPNLVWAEEFNYTGSPDPSQWNMEIGGGGWGNNELQYYTNYQTNAMVENGVLTITARQESVGGYNYTSSRMTTQDKFDFKYGRIEARMKLPYGQGIWPAFWMLGANFASVGWPACGEIDIMELVGGTDGDNTVHSTCHWDNGGSNANYGQGYTLPTGIFADEFHVFAVEWNASQIVAYVDDIRYFTISITPPALSEFHENFFIIMNVAVGGNWPGSPDATTVFPQTMEVDYVRVYEQ